MADISQDSVAWVQQLVSGNEEVFEEFWNHYGTRLKRLADQRMAPRLKQRVGPSDVIQSVCRTFIRRSREGHFRFSDTDSLWPLLCAITLTKVRQHARFHYRQRRSVGRETAQHDERFQTRDPIATQVADASPTADEVVAFAEQMEQMLGSLGDEARQLVQLRLDGYNQEEVAERMDCSERTVRRLLVRIRTQWTDMLADSLKADA